MLMVHTYLNVLFRDIRLSTNKSSYIESFYKRICKVDCEGGPFWFKNWTEYRISEFLEFTQIFENTIYINSIEKSIFLYL